MKLIRGLHNLQPYSQGCILTIGNFDGVHRGHQQLLNLLIQSAKQLHIPAVAMTFEPHPKEYFATQALPPRLSSIREKMTLLQEIPINHLICLSFNQRFANLSAQAFVETILVEKLNIRQLIIGEDFQFGRDRQGNFNYLLAMAKKYHFSVIQAPTLYEGEQRISSSLIRELLTNGDLQTAQQLLGRRYSMVGRVVKGHQRGRLIGFPTANINLHRAISPLLGVYAVEIYGVGQSPLYGVANLGSRPTVDGSNTLLEVHIFDFNQEIYGRHLHVDFCKKLRNEQKFSSVEQLKQQIITDAEQAKQFFNKYF